jgi:hypothetical protein
MGQLRIKNTTTDCLLCAASQLNQESRLRVFYNSARSNDEQQAEGKVIGVYASDNSSCRVAFVRDDGQKMEVDESGELVSYGSHFPVTGYAYQYEVINGQGQPNPSIASQ